MTTEAKGRRAVLARCGGRCERCGTPGYTVHHRRKKSQGGLWDSSNLLALCGSGTTGCHGWVEANPRSAMDLGFWLENGEKSADTAVWLWRRWVLLPDDDGSLLTIGSKYRP